ncbi:hypothetical protein [Gordonia sp. VNK21]|uniref:hypothetical protein n=1 Tax=Gordonia sp. VNK21 TaxID=3382483 RepID=UPI0038D3BB15
MTVPRSLPWSPWTLGSVETVARRMAAFGSAAAAAGVDDLVCCTSGELRTDDGGGNWVRLARDGDSVTVLSWDRDDDELPPDLVRAAVSSWRPRVRTDEPVTFVGVATLSGPQAWHLVDHGLGEAMSAFLSDDASTLEMDDFLSQRSDDEGIDFSTMRPLVRELIRRPFGDGSPLAGIAGQFGPEGVAAARRKLAELAQWWPSTTG